MSAINTFNELEFTIFCIENLAIKLDKDGASASVYNVLKQTGILNDYIVEHYDVLHTQSKEYIVNDILEVMQERNISL